MLRGRAYVYERPAVGGFVDATETAELSASDGTSQDFFGFAVAAHGDTVAVGAYRAAPIGVGPGTVYTYEKPPGGWGDASEDARLVSSTRGSGEQFGVALSLDAQALVVGAGSATVGANVTQGAVFVFERPATGTFVSGTETLRLVASDGKAADIFGQAVAHRDGTIIVGSNASVGRNTTQGASWVFEEASPWPQTGCGAWPLALRGAKRIGASVTADMTPCAAGGAEAIVVGVAACGADLTATRARLHRPGAVSAVVRSRGGVARFERDATAAG